MQDDGTVSRMSTNTDEDISQFAVDNNFQADFATGDITHTLLIGLDHQRVNTNYLSIFGFNVPDSNVNNPVYGLPITRPDRSTAFYDYNQKTRQTGLYVQDQMALGNWRLTLGGREDWVHTGTKFFNQDDATSTSGTRSSAATQPSAMCSTRASCRTCRMPSRSSPPAMPVCRQRTRSNPPKASSGSWV